MNDIPPQLDAADILDARCQGCLCTTAIGRKSILMTVTGGRVRVIHESGSQSMPAIRLTQAKTQDQHNFTIDTVVVHLVT